MSTGVNGRLRTAMARRAVTVEEAAASAHVDPKTVQRWLAGRTPHARHRWALARLLQEDEEYLWPEVGAALKERRAGELVSLYPHRADVPFDLWWGLFQDAESQIDILVYAALFLHEQYPAINELLAAKCRASCRVRVALGDPDSAAVRQRGSEETFGEGIESRCRVALRHYAPLIGTERFELRLHQTTLYNSIYRFDTHMLVNTHIWGANAYSAPVLHLRQLQGASPLFSGYAESFEAVWAAAKLVDVKATRDQPKGLFERSGSSHGELPGAGSERGGLRSGGPNPAAQTKGQ